MHGWEKIKTGIIVDEVNDVLDFKDVDLQDPPNVGNDIDSSFITGMGKIQNKVVILLDILQLLSLDEVKSLESMASSASQDSSVNEHSA